MKLVWILFGLIMASMLIYGIWKNNNITDEQLSPTISQPVVITTSNNKEKSKPQKAVVPKENILTKKTGEKTTVYTGHLPQQILPDSIVQYGLQLMGVPYLPAGITCDGFDCSGFVFHIFKKYGVNLPHSSALLAQEGEKVALENVRKGDLLIFTGTDKSDRTPGHVGVVITEPGQPVAFVHASSVGGVKISKVNGTGYERRFLQVRRVL